jgi:glucose/arabinose dehydrogenase
MSRRRAHPGHVPLVLLVAAVTTSCGAVSPAPSPDGTPVTPSSTPTASATQSEETQSEETTTPPSGAEAATGVPGAPTEVATDLPVPWSIAQLPDGEVLVSLRDEARVVRVSPDAGVSDVPSTGDDGRVPGVTPAGEGGLLGLALSPSFDDDALVFAYRTAAEGNEVVRMRLDGDRLSEPEVVLSGIPKARVHNGGRLAFGPDGMLYVTTGDAGDSDASQDLDSLGGKILRVTTGGDPAPGNPFDASPVWSYGHRNVQGIGWDAADRMYASEFGQNTLDELNLIEAGGNYGWPLVEGGGGAPEYVDPLVTWSPDEASPSGIAVTGDAVYLAALRGQRLWRVPLSDGTVGTPEAYLDGELGRLRDVATTPDDELLVLTNNTTGDPREGDDRLVRLPLG